MQKTNTKGLLFIISGPSGVGKGTIREELMKDKSINLFFSVSMTTREKRPGEENGVDYFFVTKEEFQKNIDSGNLLEWTQYVTNFYGTPRDAVEKMLNEGKNVLLEIEVTGAENVMKKMPEAISIFIAPPSFEELAARLRGRGTETEEVIERRVNTAKKELAFEKQYKYIVVNNNLDDAVNKIKQIIKGVK